MGFSSVLLLVVVAAIASLYVILTFDLEWDRMQIQNIATSDVVSSEYLFYYRVFCAVIIWSLNIYLLVDPKGLIITLVDRKGQQRELHLFGLYRFTMFTVWCWTLQGIYFAVAGICSYALLYNPALVGSSDSLLVKATWVLFEVSFAVSFLVTVVVTFVLIPGVRKQGLPTTNFFLIPALLMHNLNNSIMAIELLISKMNFALWHFPFCVLFGILYVLFQWVWVVKTGVFYYFFLDYDKPHAEVWYLGLLLAVTLFFFIGYVMDLATASGSVISCLGVMVFTMLTLQLRDIRPAKKHIK